MITIPKLEDGEQKIFFQAGGEWCYLWTLGSFLKRKLTSIVIHHHGSGGYVKSDSADWLEEQNKVRYLKAVMAGSGCAVAGSHACGDHWGNPKAVAANGALYNALMACSNFERARVGLIGGGLGGALVWNSILGPLSGRVKAVAVLQSVASLSAVIREHKFRSPCLRAYDIPEDTPDDEAVAAIIPYDPLPRLQRLSAGTPLPKTAIYHGAKDTNLPPETNAIPLTEALRKAGADMSLELFPNVGHNVYAMGRPIEERLKSFFANSL